jgi:exodeoxyribonuclease VII large subunit
VRLIVYPVPVQGAEAAERIAQMLQRVNARDEVQSVLLVRGGGSIEDLWAFNEEVLVRAIAASRLPIVVGVGHESDFTLADFAADVRAATPTAAAELVAPDRAGLLREIDRQVQRATHAAGRPAQRAAQRLDYAIRSLLAPRAPLRGLDERIAQLRERAAGSAGRLLERATAGRAAAQRALLGARPTLDHRRLGLQSLQGRAAVALRERLQQTAARLHVAGRALDTLDPHAVLRRGYSLVTDVAARVVTSAGQAPVGAVLEVRFAHGTARVDVLVSRPEAEP